MTKMKRKSPWTTKRNLEDNPAKRPEIAKLVAHHKKGWTKYPNLRYKISNGKTLCLDCHYKTHNYGWRSKWLA